MLTSASVVEEFRHCRLLNISECAVSERVSQYVLTLYNPLSRPVTEFVRLPVPAETVYGVVDPDGRTLTVQLVPLPGPVLRVPGRDSTAVAELVFRADSLPPLGYKSYLITKTTPQQQRNATGGQEPEAVVTARSVTGGQEPEAAVPRSVVSGGGQTEVRVDVGDKVTIVCFNRGHMVQ